MINSRIFLDYRWRYKIISFFNHLNIKGGRTISLWLIKILIPSPKGRVCVYAKHGFVLQVDPLEDKGLEASLYNTGTYEEGTLFVLQQILNNGDVFVDVGANIGLMSLFASTIVGTSGKVISFEPHPNTVKILKQNIALNKYANIQVSTLALGKEIKDAFIYDYLPYNRGSATLIKQGGSVKKQLVKQTTITSYFTDYSLWPSVLKLDVEGLELEVLQGANEMLTSDKAPILILECSIARENTEQQALGKIYTFLAQKNYSIYQLEKGKSRPSKLIKVNTISEMPNHDNIFCFRAHHLLYIKAPLF